MPSCALRVSPLGLAADQSGHGLRYTNNMDAAGLPFADWNAPSPGGKCI
jgi:hypothetical protein